MKIKKLLVLGAINPGAIEHLFINGFIKQGVEVDQFDIYDRYIASIRRSIGHKVINKISPSIFYQSINRDLLQFVTGKTYDVILVFKGMEIFPETLGKLKKHTTLLANFNGDHPFIYFFPGSGNKNVLNGLPFFDAHFSYSKSIVKRLVAEIKTNAFWIPFGYDSNVSAPSSIPGARYGANVVFIGAYDHERAAYIDKMKNPLLHIYGDEKWKSRNFTRPFVQQAYQGRSLYGSDYKDAISNSIGVINLLREQNLVENSHNMRTFEVPGYRGLLLSQRTSEQQEFFEDEKEAVFFDSQDELQDRISFLSGKPKLVDAIKQSGYIRSVSSGYSYDERSRQLLASLENLIK